MSTIYMDVDTALAEVPVNAVPLTDDTDFKTVEEAVAYNASGLELIWHFVTTGGATTTTVVTPTTGGDYDWAHQDGGMYTIEIPASGGASINNDTEGFGYFTGKATGVLPWRGPTICFRAAGLNNLLVDDTFSATRGLAGTALPNAAADAAGGLPISDAGGLDLDGVLSGNTPQTGDAYARLGAPVGASISADVAANLTAIGNLNDFDPATDTVILDATQANYAPAKAGDEMDLVNAPNATAITAIQSGLATSANVTTIVGHLTDIKGTGWTTTDTLEAIRDRGDAAWITATGFSTHSAADVRSEMDSNSTQFAAIVADTNELQTDWANGGRLDLILDATSTFDPASDTVAHVTLVDTTTTNTDMRGTDSAYTGTPPTAAENAAGLLDLTDGVESSYTVRGLLRLLLAVIAGNSTGSGTTYQNPAGTKNRVVSSLDGDNNRTVSSRDVS